MAKRRIQWLKWIDPFNPEDEIDMEDDEDTVTYKDSYEEMEQKQQEHNKPSTGAGPLLVGPMGVIPLNEHNQPSKVFNFWMGHTNFNIEEEVKDIIEKTPGVETLEIYTRYRFRISIGRAFDEDDVMLDIHNRLCPQEDKVKVVIPEVKPSGIDKVKSHLGSKYKFWAIFVLPNGEIDYRTGDTQDSVKEKIAKYPTKAKVLTSWEATNEAEQTSKKNGNERGIQRSFKKQGQ
jgi:hypothetical protein